MAWNQSGNPRSFPGMSYKNAQSENPRPGDPCNTANMNFPNQQYTQQPPGAINQMNGPPNMNPQFVPPARPQVNPPFGAPGNVRPNQQMPNNMNNLHATHLPPAVASQSSVLTPPTQMMRSNSAPNMPPVPGQPPRPVVNGHPNQPGPPSQQMNSGRPFPPQQPIPVINGPPQGVMSSTAGPPSFNPNTAPGPPVSMSHPGYRPAPPPTQNMGVRSEASGVRNAYPPPPTSMGYRQSVPGMAPPPPTVPPEARSGQRTEPPSELPVPYHGQAQYSTQVHQAVDPNAGLTPGSEPASQKSSRCPSPVPAQNYDALEGQWTPSQGSSGQMTPNSGGPTQPSFPKPPAAYGMPGQPPPPMPPGPPMSSAEGGITGKRVYPQMPSYAGPGMVGQPPQGMAPQPNMTGPPTGMMPPPQQHTNQPQMPGSTAGQQPPPPSGQGMANSMAPNSSAGLTNNFSQMSLQHDVTRPINLLQDKVVLPANGVETVLPKLPADYKNINCNPEVFRCTLNAIPNAQSLLSKSRLPLGILIHPFKDLSQLPVIQSSVIVRCRSCRTYINPFVAFTDSHRWKCNLCYKVNELPEEFNYDPVSKSYGDPQRRPEIKSATIEFIAPSEYMLRPPQAAVYLYVLDVSFNAIETGYLELFCQTVLDELERIPGDSRTQIGFITFDRSLHFYNLQEGLSQPQMMVVSDIEDVFLPLPDGLLVNINESKELVTDLLNSLPNMFQGNRETGSAFGAALQASFKLMSSTGGRVSVFQTQLPNVGPGALKNREDPNERSGKKIQHLGPATDFYKKLSLDCSGQQIAVDVFMLNAQYADIATLACISKYSGGCFHYFPGLHTKSNPVEADRFEGVLRRYLTRKIGFESVMRIRCSRGLSIHTFHGNFFVRSTDLLSLPNINPDAGFGMQMSIEDTIETSYVCFQAALLYTSSKGERRIRVHTMCIPVTNSITEVFSNADQVAICSLISKMAVDKSLKMSLGDARDALVNSCVDMLSAYGTTLTSSQKMGQLPCPYTLRLVPLYALALLKCTAFRVGSITNLDERVFALETCKCNPTTYLFQEIYPNLYPVHNLDDKESISKGDTVIPQPNQLQLSSGNLDRHGAYLMDCGTYMYLWLGAAVSDKFCQEVLDVPTFQAVPQDLTELPELENPTSERLRSFVTHLNDSRPFPTGFLIIREDSRQRSRFLSRLIDDRSESTFSYYEFLQHIQKEIK